MEVRRFKVVLLQIIVSLLILRYGNQRLSDIKILARLVINGRVNTCEQV